MTWENTYQSNIYPLVTIQKRAVRIISFSHFQAHASELFKKFNLVQVMDITKPYTATFMYQFHKSFFPMASFNDFFTPVCNRHRHNTRLASKSSYCNCLPQARINYGIFNIRFSGPKLWNSVKESIKSLSIFSFKKRYKQLHILAY